MITPLILNLGTSWRWVVNFTSRQLYPEARNACTVWYYLLQNVAFCCQKEVQPISRYFTCLSSDLYFINNIRHEGSCHTTL